MFFVVGFVAARVGGRVVARLLGSGCGVRVPFFGSCAGVRWWVLLGAWRVRFLVLRLLGARAVVCSACVGFVRLPARPV